MALRHQILEYTNAQFNHPIYLCMDRMTLDELSTKTSYLAFDVHNDNKWKFVNYAFSYEALLDELGQCIPNFK